MFPLTLAVGALAILPSATASTAFQSYSSWMTDSIIADGVNSSVKYQNYVFYRGVEMTYNTTGNSTYLSFIQSQIDAIVSPNGSISGYPSFQDNGPVDSLDNILMGTVLLDLYALTNTSEYKSAAALLREQLNYQPRNKAGGFWHRSPTYPDQMWLDGIYMADVFYAQWTATFDADNTTAWDDILLQFTLIEEHCRNQTTQLLVHGYDESKTAVWANPETGASPHVWNRAVGWYMMALLDVLDLFPKSHAGHAKLVDWLVTLAEGVKNAQDEAGGWWLVMDEPYPGMPGNYIESSGTAMFVYGLLRGVRMGYIGEEYLVPARKGYDLMVQKFVAQNGTHGTLNWEGTVSVGSLSGNASYEYYISQSIDENDLKGVGPFIYASIEIEALG